MDTIQITLSVIVALFGLLLAISAPTEANKRWLRIIAIAVCMGILVSQIVILKRDSREKQAQEDEYLRLKYSLVLDDNKILEKIHSFRIAKNNQQSMSIDLSPTSGTIGEHMKALWISVPCPKTLSNKYKVIDPSNYGMQDITPLYPVISLLDNQKYYIGLIAVPEDKVSPTDKLIVVTKHTNGLIEVENVDIGTHTLDMSTFRFNSIDE